MITPPMSPIQLSTLKVLDPLDHKPEHAEGDDRQSDEEQVLHFRPPGMRGTTPYKPLKMQKGRA
jgi:hypothetical protein